MKLGVTSYSFARKMCEGSMDIYDIIRKAAEMGFEGIELANLSDEWLGGGYDVEKLKKASEEAGIQVCSWALSADYSKDTEKTVARVKQEIKDAAYLGATVVRTDVCGDDVPDPFAPAIIDSLREVADYAKTLGVTLVTENHGGYFCRPERLEELVRRVGRDNYGLLCDFANYTDADVDPQEAVSKIKHLVKHVHMKDVHILPGHRIFPGEGWYLSRGGNYTRCAIVGQGNVPLLECVKSLAEIGYDGWLIHEFEGVEDCVYATARSLNFTRRLLKALPHTMWSDEITE